MNRYVFEIAQVEAFAGGGWSLEWRRFEGEGAMRTLEAEGGRTFDTLPEVFKAINFLAEGLNPPADCRSGETEKGGTE